MKIDHVSMMALYPRVTNIHVLSWDHHRISHISGVALYPWIGHISEMQGTGIALGRTKSRSQPEGARTLDHAT